MTTPLNPFDTLSYVYIYLKLLVTMNSFGDLPVKPLRMLDEVKGDEDLRRDKDGDSQDSNCHDGTTKYVYNIYIYIRDIER